MKQTKYLGLLALAAAAALAAGCASQATPTPASTVPPKATDAATDVPPEPETTTAWEVVIEGVAEQPMRMAAFLDESTGFTGGAGAGGRAHKTIDGGETWTLIESSEG